VLAAPVLDVTDILLGESGQINNHTREVHVLALSNRSIVLNTATDFASTEVHAEHSQDKRSIGNEDLLTNSHRLGQGWVRASQLMAVSLEFVVGGEDEGLALLKLNLANAVGEESRTNLGSLCIEQDSCGRKRNNVIRNQDRQSAHRVSRALTDMLILVLGSFPQALKTSVMSLMVSMGEVEASNAHAGFDEFF
jgi:hypothetical protein